MFERFSDLVSDIQGFSNTSEDEILEKRKRLGELKVGRELLRSEQVSDLSPKPRNEILRNLLDYELDQINQKIIDEEEELSSKVESFDLASFDTSMEIDKKENLRLTVKESRRDNNIPNEVFEIVDGDLDLRNKWENAEQLEDVRSEFTQLIKALRNYSNQDYGKLVRLWEPNVRLSQVDRILNDVGEECKEILEDLSEEEIRRKWEQTGANVDESVNLEDLTDSPAAIHEFMVNYVLGGNPTRMPVRIAESGMEYGNSLLAPLQTTDKSFWAKSLDTTAHEYGHTFGRENLPDEHMFLPLGEPPSEAVDEGSARFYQNYVFRTQEFLEFITGDYESTNWLSAHGISDFDSKRLYHWFNAINPDNKERISADPITYPIHILVRYELERELIESEEDVSQLIQNLESKWQNKIQKYIGDRIGKDYDFESGETVLQDVHWGKGKFGYFPCYTLGDVLAAQWRREINKDIDGNITESAAKGEFSSVNEWLVENIWKHGKSVWVRSNHTDMNEKTYCEYLNSKAEKIYN